MLLIERLEINGNENPSESQSITKPVTEPQHLRPSLSDGGTVEKNEAHGCSVKTPGLELLKQVQMVKGQLISVQL